jgi:hypothetical protein
MLLYLPKVDKKVSYEYKTRITKNVLLPSPTHP